MSKTMHEDFIRDYTSRRGEWQAYADRLKSLIADLLEARDIDYHTIEARAKSVQSLEEKLKRPGKSYTDPAHDVPDLTGVRIILYDQEGVSQTITTVDEEFCIDTGTSTDKAAELSVDQFGYLSVHKVVSLEATRASMTEWVRFAGMHAEVQIRTVLQHAWASISHKLHYKREAEIPLQIRRRLTRLAGLFELADDEFLSLRTADGTIRKAIAEEVTTGVSSVPIDSVSLSTWAKQSRSMVELHKAVEFSTCRIESSEGDLATSQLLEVAEDLGITNLDELEEVMNIALKKGANFYSELNYSMPGDLPHFAAVLLIAANQQLFKDSTAYPFPSEEYIAAIAKAAKKVFGGANNSISDDKQ